MSTPRVQVSETTVTLPTYHPLPPERFPMFLEKRVYQGSSGKVYPLPFYDRIAEQPVPHPWRAIFLENEFLEVMILPDLGGRIHAARDKTNGYDVFYRQEVIKPALVGLAGPWISGGVEFNWPQHHRPATYLPVETEIERSPDGSVTIWCSDHDPLQRMKGMHGVCLRPGRSVIELRVRVHNRTELTQTFLWWANVATRVHEAYQSFFPPDVDYVADHARRSMSAFPFCEGRYYGVNYGARKRQGVPAAEAPPTYVPPASGGRPPVDYPPNDLSFYANIPVPTSYMCIDSEGDFFGGYDHRERAGVVHVANHHISPGKKQWTWGNHRFGYAWDRNLTDPDTRGESAPYIEIMAGVYTDNQPDFAFLSPGETKTWSQFWYPIREIGPATAANNEVAVSLRRDGKGWRAGVSATAVFKGATVALTEGHKVLCEERVDLSPANPLTFQVKRGGANPCLTVRDAKGGLLMEYAVTHRENKPVPAAATEPPAPEEIRSVDELYLTGLHLSQYRHATRDPEIYWQEAIRRDADDSRCRTALGIRCLTRGDFTLAEAHLRRAVDRLTIRNANPETGETHYHLGLTLRFLGRVNEAYAFLYKSAWNQAWRSAAYVALAEIDGLRGHWTKALEHARLAQRTDADQLRARHLEAMASIRLGCPRDAQKVISATLEMDPLDAMARFLAGKNPPLDNQTRLDLALDLARAGWNHEALAVLEKADPMAHYARGWLFERMGDADKAARERQNARRCSPDYCFPSRIEEIPILESAIAADPNDAIAPFVLGNLFYDKRRHPEAIQLWKRSVAVDPKNAVAWRNLGIGFFNILRKPAAARRAYDHALKAAPADPRLVYERDQLWKRTGERPARRLRELRRYPEAVLARDDLTVEFCALCTMLGRPEEALERLIARAFQPWEGGEGLALGQFVKACLALGRNALAAADLDRAIHHISAALEPPSNLAEARHLLANDSNVHFWLGEALSRAGRRREARIHWKTAAEFRGDFEDMSVRAFSDKTFFSAMSLRRLGKKAAAQRLFNDLLKYAKELEKSRAKIDYFATSLPNMLLFEDDLQKRQETAARFLQAQAHVGLGDNAAARRLLSCVLEADPAHADALDLLQTL